MRKQAYKFNPLYRAYFSVHISCSCICSCKV